MNPLLLKTRRHGGARPGRLGFTILETTLALGVLAVAMTLLAEVGIWCLSERLYNSARQDALEQAANILETARATPWEALTPEWADARKLSSELDQRLTDAKLSVRVEPEQGRPRTRRVTVEIGWQINKDHPAKPVKLVTLFSARGEENKP